MHYRSRALGGGGEADHAGVIARPVWLVAAASHCSVVKACRYDTSVQKRLMCMENDLLQRRTYI